MDNIYIRFGAKLYRQIVGIPMGTNCAPLVADLFLFCYEIDFLTSLSDFKQAEIIEAFNQVREVSIFTSVSKNSNRYKIYLWKTSHFARLFCLHIQEESGA